MYVNEMFTSIQGEGHFTGTPAHFIRFQGCPIHCQWCDSKNSWDRVSYLDFPLAAILATFAELREKQPEVDHVVLTGGEPLWNNPELLPLIEHLCDQNFRVQIETSGTQPCSDEFLEYIRYAEVYPTISPKAPIKTAKEFLPVDEKLLEEAYELKFPVTGKIDIEERIPRFLELYLEKVLNEYTYMYLQPVMEGGKLDPDLVKLVVDEALKRNWKVSVQTHKVLFIR